MFLVRMPLVTFCFCLANIKGLSFFRIKVISSSIMTLLFIVAVEGSDSCDATDYLITWIINMFYINSFVNHDWKWGSAIYVFTSIYYFVRTDAEAF